MRGAKRWLSGACLSLVGFMALATVTYGLDDKLEISGDVRIKMRHIDSPDTGALSGTYGEALQRGFMLRHRLVLEVAYPLTEQIRAGGMLRASDEGQQVLEAGPEYLSSEFGSAFVEYETPELRSRLGYYTVAYSPLTLMRWDATDDPEGGAGCGCSGSPGVGGAILGESLEELGPNLTFEGGRVSFTPKGLLGIDGFLARPRTAGNNYQLITYGGRASLTKYAKETESFFDVGLLAIRSEEDEHSLAGGLSGGPPYRNTVVGLTWKAPVAKWVSLDGEFTGTRSAGLEKKRGMGTIASLNFRPSHALKLETSFIFLTQNWESYFRALSYNPDRQGFRARLEYQGDRVLVALFARYLRTFDETDGVIIPSASAGTSSSPDSRLGYPTLSLRTTFKVNPALNAGLAAIYAGETNHGDHFTLDADTKRITGLGTLTYKFAEASALTLEERYIWNRVKQVTATDRNYGVSMLTLYVRAAIW